MNSSTLDAFSSASMHRVCTPSNNRHERAWRSARRGRRGQRSGHTPMLPPGHALVVREAFVSMAIVETSFAHRFQHYEKKALG